jgi:hypothetical protein
MKDPYPERRNITSFFFSKLNYFTEMLDLWALPARVHDVANKKNDL